MASGEGTSESGIRPIIGCTGCGYDVAGLPESGACPECAAPIAATMAARPLARSDAQWLHDVRSGSLLVLIAAAIVPATGVGTLLMVAGFGGSIGHDPVFSMGMLLAACLASRGWWLLTRVEPGAPRPGLRRVVGAAIRLTAATGTAALLVDRVLVQALGWMGRYDVGAAVQHATAPVLAGAALLHFTLAMWSFGATARRAGDRGWSRACRRIAVGIGVYVAASTAAVWSGIDFTSSWVGGAAGFVPLPAIVLVIAILVYDGASIAALTAPWVYLHAAYWQWSRVRRIDEARTGRSIASEPHA